MSIKGSVTGQKGKSCVPKWWNWLKWLLVCSLLALLVVGHYHARGYPVKARIALLLGGSVLLGLSALWTTEGREAWRFCQSAFVELKKVIWPKRKEVTQITIVALILIVIMALVLWGYDSTLRYVVSWIAKWGTV